MSRDATLDQFGGDDADAAVSDASRVDASGTDASETGATATNESETAADADDADADDADAVVPAAATYQWRPSGRPCAACGDRVERRWRDGDDWVCASCKPWSETERRPTESGE